MKGFPRESIAQLPWMAVRTRVDQSLIEEFKVENGDERMAYAMAFRRIAGWIGWWPF